MMATQVAFMLQRRSGFSIVEVLVALAVISLALGPLINLLSSSNRASNASIYEVMAVHYASELAEQLERLSGKLGEILADARIRTGNPGLTLEDLLTDNGFTNELRAHNDQPRAVPFQAQGIPLEVSLFVSSLHQHFTERKFDLRQLNNSATTWLKTGRYWDVKITFCWRIMSSDAPDSHKAEFSVILKE